MAARRRRDGLHGESEQPHVPPATRAWFLVVPWKAAGEETSLAEEPQLGEAKGRMRQAQPEVPNMLMATALMLAAGSASQRLEISGNGARSLPPVWTRVADQDLAHQEDSGS